MRRVLFIFLFGFINGVNAMDRIDFKNFTLPESPNYYLVCPQDYCAETPNQISPIYPVSLEKLLAAWQRLIKLQKRVNRTAAEENEHHYQYVQRSFLFRFPDYIDIQFIELSSEKSTLAIFSRAKYGYYDFKVNEKRVKAWLKALEQVLAEHNVN